MEELWAINRNNKYCYVQVKDWTELGNKLLLAFVRFVYEYDIE